MKKLICAVLSIALFSLCFYLPLSATDEISVYIDGTRLEFDVPPCIIDGSTMVPMRKIFEALGADISWDQSAQTVTAQKDGTVISLSVGKNLMTLKNDEEEKRVYLSAAPILDNSRVLIPLRSVSTAFGAGVVWHGGTSSIYIYSAKKLETPQSRVEAWDPHHLRTSYGDYEYTDFSISGNTLTVSYLTNDERVSEMWVRLGNESKIVRVFTDTPSTAAIPLNSAVSGPSEELTVYLKTDKDSAAFKGYIWRRLYIYKQNGDYIFAKPQVFDYNIERAYTTYSVSESFVPGISREIETLSDKICKNASSDYEKLSLIHDWVAENIYYDYDSFYGNSSNDRSIDADNVLSSGKSICEGYANLVCSLANAQGIPCVKVSGYGLGVGTDGEWNDQNASIMLANHSWNRAYADGRWINIDTAWDSGNEYSGGKFSYGGVRYHIYFDTSEAFLSLSHKYTQFTN